MTQLSNDDLYRMMYRIRCFEETVLEQFSKGVFFGTSHTYIGQEADAVGILSNRAAGDIIFSNHRCHGHFLAYGGDSRSLFAELMGRATGVCGGRGGSQHLQWKDFYSNGIQGGIVPVGTGMALAEKLSGSGAVVIIFIGDGTLGEGALYESLNMASLWSLPVLYVVENNGIAQTTPIELSVAGSIPGRFEAFGIRATEISTSDVAEIGGVAAEIIDQVRQDTRPQAIICHTHRFGPHSKGDDTRDPQEMELIRREHDPLLILAERMDKDRVRLIEQEIDDQIRDAFETALADPFPEPKSTLARGVQ